MKGERAHTSWRSHYVIKRIRMVDLSTLVAPSHLHGSRSSIEIARRLAKDNNGEMLLASDLYLVSHSKVLESGEKVLSGKKAHGTMNAYKRKLDEYKIQGTSYVPHPNDVWYEVSGGYQKGKVHGLGQNASMYYEKPSIGSSRSSSSISSVTAISASQAQQVEELMKQNEPLRKEREEEKKTLENVRKEQEEMNNASLECKLLCRRCLKLFRKIVIVRCSLLHSHKILLVLVVLLLVFDLAFKDVLSV